MRERAIEKLDREFQSGKYDRHGQVMKRSVLNAMKEFCEQDEEFAQAVVQGDSFEGCMKAVAQGVGSAISDLEAYRKAVQFYFPTAEVRFQMKIDLVPHDTEDEPTAEEPERKRAVVVDLADFL